MSSTPSSEAVAAAVQSFRERAMAEALRYGADPWVFVRELLQNARDAGARRIDFEVRSGAGTESLTCRDDGDGMTLEHARRYLFSLYSSSKEGVGDQVGRFGVGFWSVLRFAPTRIYIGSHPRVGTPWALELSGDLTRIEHAAPPLQPGTEIVLHRPVGDGMLERRVRDAARQSGRFLIRRATPEAPAQEELPVVVRVAGVAIQEPFDLPAPSSSFRVGDMRGVVGLGPRARVELFSRGLRVRAAAALDDLLPARAHSQHTRVAFTETPGGLAPEALLEHPGLQLLLSRQDARDDRALRRLVEVARRETEILVDEQVALLRGDPWWRRAADRAARLPGVGPALAAGGLVAVGAAAMSLAWQVPVRDGRSATPAAAVVSARPVEEPAAWRDLGPRYFGPRVDPGMGPDPRVQLEYTPADRDLYFAGRRIAALDRDGRPRPASSDELPPYDGVRCSSDCVEVRLRVAPAPGGVRLPLPTGYEWVQGSLRIDGRAVIPRRSPDGLPFIAVTAGPPAVATYQVAPAPTLLPDPVSEPLPAGWRSVVANAAAVREPARATFVARAVAERIRYDRSEITALRYAQAHHLPFLERAAQVGAGDCDVQNAVVARLLQETGLPAVLALGFVGRAGRATASFHAWVETPGPGGRLRVVDATVFGADAGGAPMISAAPTKEDARLPAAVAPAAEALEPAAGASPQPPAPRGRGTGESSPTPPWPIARIRGALSWPTSGSALLLLVLLSLSGLAAWFLARRHTRRRLTLDASIDLAGLVEGALRHPAAFAALRGIYDRPLLPTFPHGRISLDRARHLAARLRLRSARDPDAAPQLRWWPRAREVLDVRAPEAAAAARALGALDLDRWRRLLSSSLEDPVTAAVNLALRDAGEDFTVRGCRGLGAPLALGDDPSGGARIALLDLEAEPLRSALDLPPAAGALAVVESLVQQMRLAQERGRRVLTAAAGRAIREAVEGSG